MAFELTYHAGESFDTSYFVGREGSDLKVVRASLVIPADIQEEVSKVESDGKEHTEIIGPEEAVEQIKTACGGTMDGFKKWADEVKSLAKSASFQKKADAPTFTFSEKEVEKVQLPKDGEKIETINTKEAEAGKTEDLPKSKGTKVKQFYNRLPKNGPGDAEKTINLQSDVHQQYQIALQALAEAAEKNDLLKKENEDLQKGKEQATKEKENIEKEFGKVKDEMDVDKKKGDIDGIVAAIKKGAKLDPEAEKTVVDTLSPLDPKALKAISKVISTIFAEKGEKDVPPANPFEPKKASAMPGVNLPQLGVPGTESAVTLIEKVAGYFDHQ